MNTYTIYMYTHSWYPILVQTRKHVCSIQPLHFLLIIYLTYIIIQGKILYTYIGKYMYTWNVTFNGNCIDPSHIICCHGSLSLTFNIYKRQPVHQSIDVKKISYMKLVF